MANQRVLTEGAAATYVRQGQLPAGFYQRVKRGETVYYTAKGGRILSVSDKQGRMVEVIGPGRERKAPQRVVMRSALDKEPGTLTKTGARTGTVYESARERKRYTGFEGGYQELSEAEKKVVQERPSSAIFTRRPGSPGTLYQQPRPITVPPVRQDVSTAEQRARIARSIFGVSSEEAGMRALFPTGPRVYSAEEVNLGLEPRELGGGMWYVKAPKYKQPRLLPLKTERERTKEAIFGAEPQPQQLIRSLYPSAKIYTEKEIGEGVKPSGLYTVVPTPDTFMEQYRIRYGWYDPRRYMMKKPEQLELTTAYLKELIPPRKRSTVEIQRAIQVRRAGLISEATRRGPGARVDIRKFSPTEKEIGEYLIAEGREARGEVGARQSELFFGATKSFRDIAFIEVATFGAGGIAGPLPLALRPLSRFSKPFAGFVSKSIGKTGTFAKVARPIAKTVGKVGVSPVIGGGISLATGLGGASAYKRGDYEEAGYLFGVSAYSGILAGRALASRFIRPRIRITDISKLSSQVAKQARSGIGVEAKGTSTGVVKVEIKPFLGRTQTYLIQQKIMPSESLTRAGLTTGKAKIITETFRFDGDKIGEMLSRRTFKADFRIKMLDGKRIFSVSAGKFKEIGLMTPKLGAKDVDIVSTAFGKMKKGQLSPEIFTRSELKKIFETTVYDRLPRTGGTGGVSSLDRSTIPTVKTEFVERGAGSTKKQFLIDFPAAPIKKPAPRKIRVPRSLKRVGFIDVDVRGKGIGDIGPIIESEIGTAILESPITTGGTGGKVRIPQTQLGALVTARSLSKAVALPYGVGAIPIPQIKLGGIGQVGVGTITASRGLTVGFSKAIGEPVIVPTPEIVGGLDYTGITDTGITGQIGTPSVGVPTIAPPNIISGISTIPLIPLVPPFGGGGGGGPESPLIFPRFKMPMGRVTSYRPSLLGTRRVVRGKKPRTYTGVEIRPIYIDY